MSEQEPMATGPAPAWLVLNEMADAITDERWMTFDPNDGHTMESWAEAKEAHFQAIRDDCCIALLAMERKGWVRLDWDEEEPEVEMMRAEDILAETATNGSCDP